MADEKQTTSEQEQPEKKQTTLCQSCSIEDGHGNSRCSWMRELVPVIGWDAEKTIVKSGTDSYYTSYCVKACPLYHKATKFYLLKNWVTGTYVRGTNGKIKAFKTSRAAECYRASRKLDKQKYIVERVPNE